MSESGKTEKKAASPRREFLKTSALMAAGAAAISAIPALPRAYAEGTDAIKVGVIGAGGRASGAAVDCLNAGGNVKIVAIGDAFEGAAKGLMGNLGNLAKKDQYKGKIDVAPEKVFSGLDSFQKVIDSGIDMVVTATPPGFRAQHFEAAVKAGKHVFMEKPVCVDAGGYRKVMAAAKMADEKKLKVVVGLQRHHDSGYLGGIKAIADGKYGDITLLRVYWNGDGIWHRGRAKDMTEMQFQVHNWYHFCWASGDQLCEQHVHNLDIGNWVMSTVLNKTGAEWAHPVAANGMGAEWHRRYGDFIRTVKGNNKGQIFDAHFVEFTYENGTKMYSQCRHQPNTFGSVAEAFHSTTKPDGKKNIAGCGVAGAGPGPKLQNGNAYVQEHIDLQTAIKEDKPCNEAYYGATSSMTAVLGRMATYSGKTVWWDAAVEFGADTFPPELTWAANPPVMPDEQGNYPIPVPGQYVPYDAPKGWKPKKAIEDVVWPR